MPTVEETQTRQIEQHKQKRVELNRQRKQILRNIKSKKPNKPLVVKCKEGKYLDQKKDKGT